MIRTSTWDGEIEPAIDLDAPQVDELAARRRRRAPKPSARTGSEPPSGRAPQSDGFDSARPGWLDDPEFVPTDVSGPDLAGPDSEVLDFNRPELGANFDNPEYHSPATNLASRRPPARRTPPREPRPGQPFDGPDFDDPDFVHGFGDGYDDAQYAADLAREAARTADPRPAGPSRIAGRSDDRVAGRAGDRVAGRTDDRVGGRTDDRVAGRTDDRVADRADDRVVGRADDRVAGRTDDRLMGRLDDRVAGRVADRADDRVVGRAEPRDVGRACPARPADRVRFEQAFDADGDRFDPARDGDTDRVPHLDGRTGYDDQGRADIGRGTRNADPLDEAWAPDARDSDHGPESWDADRRGDRPGRHPNQPARSRISTDDLDDGPISGEARRGPSGRAEVEWADEEVHDGPIRPVGGRRGLRQQPHGGQPPHQSSAPPAATGRARVPVSPAAGPVQDDVLELYRPPRENAPQPDERQDLAARLDQDHAQPERDGLPSRRRPSPGRSGAPAAGRATPAPGSGRSTPAAANEAPAVSNAASPATPRVISKSAPPVAPKVIRKADPPAVPRVIKVEPPAAPARVVPAPPAPVAPASPGQAAMPAAKATPATAPPTHPGTTPANPDTATPQRRGQAAVPPDLSQSGTAASRTDIDLAKTGTAPHADSPQDPAGAQPGTAPTQGWADNQTGMPPHPAQPQGWTGNQTGTTPHTASPQNWPDTQPGATSHTAPPQNWANAQTGTAPSQDWADTQTGATPHTAPPQNWANAQTGSAPSQDWTDAQARATPHIAPPQSWAEAQPQQWGDTQSGATARAAVPQDRSGTPPRAPGTHAGPDGADLPLPDPSAGWAVPGQGRTGGVAPDQGRRSPSQPVSPAARPLPPSHTGPADEAAREGRHQGAPVSPAARVFPALPLADPAALRPAPLPTVPGLPVEDGQPGGPAQVRPDGSDRQPDAGLWTARTPPTGVPVTPGPGIAEPPYEAAPRSGPPADTQQGYRQAAAVPPSVPTQARARREPTAINGAAPRPVGDQKSAGGAHRGQHRGTPTSGFLTRAADPAPGTHAPLPATPAATDRPHPGAWTTTEAQPQPQTQPQQPTVPSPRSGGSASAPATTGSFPVLENVAPIGKLSTSGPDIEQRKYADADLGATWFTAKTPAETEPAGGSATEQSATRTTGAPIPAQRSAGQIELVPEQDDEAAASGQVHDESRPVAPVEAAVAPTVPIPRQPSPTDMDGEPGGVVLDFDITGLFDGTGVTSEQAVVVPRTREVPDSDPDGPDLPLMPGPEPAEIAVPVRPLKPLSAEDLDAIRWRLDGGTLREVVDDRDALRDLGDRLDEPLAEDQDNVTRSGLLSVRAEVYRLLGELGMAAAASRLALAHAESAADVQAMVIAQAELAHVLRLRGDFTEADRLFEEAASSESAEVLRSVVHENAGRSCFDQGRHMEALDHFARAVRLGDPEDTDLVERIGVCLEAVYIHVLRDGWGPYPRLRREILGPVRPPAQNAAPTAARSNPIQPPQR